jgi:agmatine deiminase
MITDQQTNFLFLADSLPTLYPSFYSRFQKVLNQYGITPSLLPNTNDVWAVDYMPIQIEEDSFIQFVYDPDYLISKAERKTISDVDSICKKIGITPMKSNIILDGGNVIRAKDKIIMTDKIIKSNPSYTNKQLIAELEKLFQVEKLIFIPVQPGDFTGHADGMVRFLNDDTVIINDYKDEEPDFKRTFLAALKNAGLKHVEIPYNLNENDNDDQAHGCYINYLQMENLIIVPTFGLKEDDQAVRKFEELFPGQTIAAVDSREIAEQGGVLNCITWNIKK